MQIIENGEQQDVTEEQAKILLRNGICYNDGEGNLHMCEGKTFSDVDACILQ